MTNVFVVVNQGWGGVVVEGVFSTFEKAQQWIHDHFTNTEGVTSDDAFNCFIQVLEVK